MTVSEISNRKRYVGVAADDKPTGAPAGSRFLEADTGAEFIYDGSSWTELPASGGGGAALLGPVTVNYDDADLYEEVSTDALVLWSVAAGDFAVGDVLLDVWFEVLTKWTEDDDAVCLLFHLNSGVSSTDVTIGDALNGGKGPKISGNAQEDSVGAWVASATGDPKDGLSISANGGAGRRLPSRVATSNATICAQVRFVDPLDDMGDMLAGQLKAYALILKGT